MRHFISKPYRSDDVHEGISPEKVHKDGYRKRYGQSSARNRCKDVLSNVICMSLIRLCFLTPASINFLIHFDAR